MKYNDDVMNPSRAPMFWIVLRFRRCFESGSPSFLPRKLGQLCGENSGLPTLCTDGWEGKGALAEGRAAAGEDHYIYIYLYVPTGEKIWENYRCNVVNPIIISSTSNFDGLRKKMRGESLEWWWPLVWVKRIPSNVWKIPVIAELLICKSCQVFPMCFTNHWKFKIFFWERKTCWSCFVWEIVHHVREFFFRKLLCSQCFPIHVC